MKSGKRFQKRCHTNEVGRYIFKQPKGCFTLVWVFDWVVLQKAPNQSPTGFLATNEELILF
ncbi:Uncharacterised protein [Vibrio cholerae]|nr:Uncharacterised protein [Vibrio cholerae]